VKSRILFVFCGLILLWTAVLLRAATLQLFPNEKLKSLQARQFQTTVNLQSRRGAIVDRKGRDLALSARTYSVYADPKLLENKKVLSRRLAKVLGLSPQALQAKMRGIKRFNWLARQISKLQAEEIRSWEIRGLSVLDEFQRVYPNESLLAQGLGMIGSDGRGLEGLELQYDNLLRGNHKKVAVRRDARGRPLLMNGLMVTDEADGAEIHLTIDTEIQHMLQNELDTAVHEFDADQAFGVILDAKTSAIVAMVNTPSFDANLAGKMPPETRRSRVITDTFEPGSTLKTIAVAIGLREKILAPNTKYNTENGVFKVADHFIREAETNHKWSQLTVSEILAYSSNIGATKIAFDLGAETLRKGLIDFGFGSKTGVDLPGEGKGILLPLPWNPHLLSNISFGQGISTTPLQIANAYAAIANGGTLNTPFLVNSIRDPETGEVTEMKPRRQRQVLTPEEAEQLRMMLLGVTAPGGTGVNANVEGFLVGGKTGTAQIPNPVGRGYLPKAYLSSFAGFFPAQDPQFVIYIGVDHPKKTSYYGATVAAPVFSRVASYAARLQGLAPVLLTKKNLPPSAGYQALQVLVKNQLSPKKKDSGHSQVLVKAGAMSAQPQPSEILNGAQVLPQPSGLMPDLNALSMREVLQKFSGSDVQLHFMGTGQVSQTVPEAGVPLGSQQNVKVILK